jgi:hypothetical protein
MKLSLTLRLCTVQMIATASNPTTQQCMMMLMGTDVAYGLVRDAVDLDESLLEENDEESECGAS